MKIKVTQDDIDKGKRCLINQCPIALAVRRGTGLPTVYIGAVHFITGKFERVTLPPAAIEFIKKFDQQATVKPFEFELEFPT